MTLASPGLAWAQSAVCAASTAPALDCAPTGWWSTQVFAGDSDVLVNYTSCNASTANGNEYVHPFVCPYTGNVTIELANTDCDVDIYVVGDSCDTVNDCIDADIAAGSGAGVQGTAQFFCLQGETYYVSVEAWAIHNAPGTCPTYMGFRYSNYDIYAYCDEDCGDGVDNDGDGNVDCADADCVSTCCDADGDGVASPTCGGSDCDDNNPNIFPTSPEIAGDGIDQDCDNADLCYVDDDGDGFGGAAVAGSLGCAAANEVAVPGDCDDGNADRAPDQVEILASGVDEDCDGNDLCYADLDGDGFGGAGQPVPSNPFGCANTPGAGVTGDDCANQDPAINPGAQEVCGGGDEDCDGLVDTDDPDLILGGQAFADVDGDGWGAIGTGILLSDCVLPSGTVGQGGDCDDADPAISPDATDIPWDGIDQDCSGSDRNDVDGDGVVGFQAGGPDCDDTDANIGPGRPEILANGIDDNCNGMVDENSGTVDDDGDGFAELGGDCNDANPMVSPSGIETCDGVDQDCDGQIDEGTECYDDDGDGETELTGDCNDTNSAINPDALELDGNGIDDDCDGVVDASQPAFDGDGDGYTTLGGDCDDSDASRFPGAVEVGDGFDQDCDGIVDEGTTRYDDDGDTWTEIAGDCNDRDASTYPGAPDLADGRDNDCDGLIDDGSPTVDTDGDGVTPAEGDCDDRDPATHPDALEVVDGLDNDCDGIVDGENAVDPADADGDGVRAMDGDCDDSDPWILPGAPEPCDGVDNDCNGTVDDLCGNALTALPGKLGCQTAPRTATWWLLGLGALAIRRRRAT